MGSRSLRPSVHPSAISVTSEIPQRWLNNVAAEAQGHGSPPWRYFSTMTRKVRYVAVHVAPCSSRPALGYSF